MKRRGFVIGGAVAALLGGAGALTYAQVPPIPARPEPDAQTAASWIMHRAGRFVLTLPRIEMGQNIATGLKQIACAELGVGWDAVDVALHDTGAAGVKPTVGSESIQLFAEPLAQACAALRDALAAGEGGEVEVVLRPASDLRALRPGGMIGASPPLTQGREIVTGGPLYAADVRLPGMLYGRVLRAPVAVEVASAPRRWDAEAGARVPGFVAIVEDAGPAIGRARGLGIVASRPGALDRIAEAMAVEWTTGPRHPRADVAASIDVDLRLSDGRLRNRMLEGTPTDGPWDVDLRLDIPPAAHAPIEPRAAVAAWEGEALKVWAGNQDAFYVRDVLAREHGLSKDAVTVQSRRVGGAFGGKTICTVEAESAALARAVAAPVKVQWTRAQEYQLGFHRPPSSHRVRARVAGSRITDWDHAQVTSHVMFTSAVVPLWMQRGTDALTGDGGAARGMAAPYALGRARAAYDVVRLPFHTGPWRGLGAGPNALAIEIAMDEAARAAGADPLRFRLNHVEDPRVAGVLERVAEVAGWTGPAPSEVADLRTGRGLACGIYKGVSYGAAIADVSVAPDGAVAVTGLWCAHDCGLVVNPDQVRAQCEGNLVWSLGMILRAALPLEDGRPVAETYADAPIPSLAEVPPMTVSLTPSDAPPTGAGETLIVAGPGAIANAIRAATGQPVDRLPVRPERLAI